MILLLPAAVSCMIFAAAETVISLKDNSVQLSNSFMMLFIIAELFVFFRLIKAASLNKLLVTVILIHYAAILFTVSNSIIRLPFLSDASAERKLPYGPASILSFLLITAATFPAVFAFLSRVVRPALRLSDNKSMRRGFVYLMAALLLYCAAAVFFDFNFDRSSYTNTGIAVLFASFMITDCILYYMFFSEMKLVMENDRLTSRIQSFDEQYRSISMSIERSRRARHDIRQHLSAISAMNKRGESKAISEYLEAYTAACSELDEAPLCGYFALDNILRYYISLAKEKDIEVRTEFHPIRPDMEFDVTDITVLAGNLMENAVEACEQLPSEAQRRIRIWIKQTDVSLLIMIENSCRSGLENHSSFSESENFVSTKHSGHGGQGLTSIRLAAEKYGGSAEFKRENGIFTSRIVLNIP